MVYFQSPRKFLRITEETVKCVFKNKYPFIQFPTGIGVIPVVKWLSTNCKPQIHIGGTRMVLSDAAGGHKHQNNL